MFEFVACLLGYGNPYFPDEKVQTAEELEGDKSLLEVSRAGETRDEQTLISNTPSTQTVGDPEVKSTTRGPEIQNLTLC